MNKSDIDLEALVQKVREVASEDPECVYLKVFGSCNYVRHGKASCLVGQGASRLGVSSSTLGEWDRLGSIGGVLMDVYGYAPSDPAIEWLTYVQGEQDNGTPWGLCIQRADTYLKNRDPFLQNQLL